MDGTKNEINRRYLNSSILICILFLLAGCSSKGVNATPFETSQKAMQSTLISTPLISRNVPAFSSSYSPASYANDDSYDTSWRSQGTPSWLAYDLSSVPSSHRNKVLLVWYNGSFNYDHTLINTHSYNMPENYTIDVNSAPGGGSPPDSGWRTLVTVNGNHYHSRQHVIDMQGSNWIRMFVTASDGVIENYDVNINMDVYDANRGLNDDFIDYGDSITATAMGHETQAGIKSFSQLINAQLPDYFPVEENGGIGYLLSWNGAQYISLWLALFPGRYVGLSYGTNDELSCTNASIIYNNYVTMVQDVIRVHKIPIVPQLIWSTNENVQKCGPAVNAILDQIYKNFPQVIPGPDLWTLFQGHPNYFIDGIHPNAQGIAIYRQAWANTFVKSVYKN